MKTHVERVKNLAFLIARTSISETRIGTGHNQWVDAQSWFILGNEYMDFIEFLQDELGYEELKEMQDKFFNRQAKSMLKVKL